MNKRVEQFLNGARQIDMSLKGGAFELSDLQKMRDTLLIFLNGINKTIAKATPVHADNNQSTQCKHDCMGGTCCVKCGAVP